MPDEYPPLSDESQRRKRYERQETPTRARITERDKRVIEAVYHYRVLTTRQINRLIFTGKDRRVGERRLALLYDWGYLERRRPMVASASSSANFPILYMLGQRGSEYLIKSCGYDEVRWRPQHNSIGYEHVEHLLAINEFRVEVALACVQAGHTLLDWQDDTTLKKDYDRVTLVTGRRSQQVAIIPDGSFAVDTPRGETHLFLELDRGNMESKRFKRKVLAYLAYYQNGKFEQRYKKKAFRVLVVTEGKRRGDNLKVATEEVGGKSLFWFGVLPELTAERIFSEAVWQVASRKQPAILIR